MQNHKPLYEYADIIKKDWRKLSPYAEPYLNAMRGLNQITDDYYLDSAQSVVLYFLSNASGWRGDTARAIKKELRELAK